MNIDSWEIILYERVGQLKFGINQDEARNILGKEELKDFDKTETTLYWQENAVQLTFDDYGLANVSFYPYIENIVIENKSVNWNKTNSLFKWLLKNDPSVREGLGIFIFFKFGVSVVDFDHSENDDKSMSVFRKGYWTEDDPLLRPMLRPTDPRLN